MAVATKQLAGNIASVFNGYSFIGRNIMSRLGKEGCSLVNCYRGSGYDEGTARPIGGLGQMQLVHYHLKDNDSLYRAMEHSDIVINCIGKINETRNFSFDEVHVEGPRRMARIAREVGVKKFIHFSHLNANPDPKPVVLKKGSRFLQSKYYGELAVLEEFPDATIFRPSDVAGESDDFINHFTSLYRSRYLHRLAIWDYYYEVEKQPVLVNNLVDGVLRALEDDSTNGKIIQAVGPYRYDFYELIEYIRACGGQGQKYDEYDIVNLRFDFLMRLMITIVEKTQKYPYVTWERVELDSISDHIDPKLPTLESLGVKLTPLEIWIETLAFYRPRHHRVEIPYQSRDQIDLPTRLNLQKAM